MYRLLNLEIRLKSMVTLSTVRRFVPSEALPKSWSDRRLGDFRKIRVRRFCTVQYNGTIRMIQSRPAIGHLERHRI